MPIVDAKGVRKKHPGRTEPTTTATAMKIDDQSIRGAQEPKPGAAVVMFWWLAVQAFTAAAAATAHPPYGATTSTAIRTLQVDGVGAAPSPPTCNLIDDVFNHKVSCSLDQYCDDIHTLRQTESRHLGAAGNVDCKPGDTSGGPYFFVAQYEQMKLFPTGLLSGLFLRVNYGNLIESVTNPPPRVVFAEGVSFHLDEVTTESCTMTLAGEPCYYCEFCRNEDGNQTTAHNFSWFAVDCANVYPDLIPTTCMNPIGWIEFLKQVEKEDRINTTLVNQQPTSTSLCNTKAGRPPSTTFSRKEVMIAAFVSVGMTIFAVIMVGALAGLRVVRAAPRRPHQVDAPPAPPTAHGPVMPSILEPESALPPPPAAPMAEVPATGPMESVSTLSSRMMMMMSPRRCRTDPPVVVATARTLPLPIIAEAVLMVDPSRSAVAALRGDNHHHDNNHHLRNNEDNYVPSTNGPLFKDQAQSSEYSI
jgi:hypothetical protein